MIIKRFINNIRHKEKVTKETLWAMCAKGVSALGGLFVIIFVPKVAGVEVFGGFSLILAYVLIFGVLAGVPVQEAIKKEVTEGKWDARSKLYFIESIKIKIITSFTATIFIFIIVNVCHIYVLRDNFFLFLILMITRNFWGSIVSNFEASHRLIYVAVIYIVEWVVKIVAIIICYCFYELTVKALVLSFFMGYISAFVVGAAIVIKKYGGISFCNFTSFDSSILKKILPRTFYLALTSLSLILLARIDVIMISYYLSLDYVGFYNIASDISKQIVFISLPFILGIVPLFVTDKQPSILFKNSLRKLCVINIIVCILIFICSEYVILLLYGKQFMEVVTILKILAIYPLCAVMQLFIQKTLILFDKTKQILLFGLCAVALNIILNALFIPLFNMIGAAIATIISYIIWNIISFIYINKLLCEKTKTMHAMG